MSLAPLLKHSVARKSAGRKAMFPLAATLTVQLALSNAAFAQTTELSIDQNSNCDHRPVSFAAIPRVEPGAERFATAKTNAILGVAMSKLEQMRSIQSSSPLVKMDSAVVPATEQPSQILPICAGTSDNYVVPTGAVTRPFNDAILGAQSVTVTRTPFDRDWAAVQTRPNKSRIQRAISSSGAVRSADKLQQLEIVNRWVNQNIAFAEDRDVYSVADYWAPAGETLRRGTGDCEDFAIAKMEMLSALGIARSDMRLIIARDLVRNADHAVLVVKLDSGSVMLDNATDRLLDGRLANDYRPIMSFSQNAKWLHGYVVQQPAVVRVAALPLSAPPAPRQFPDVIAVTAEPEILALSLALLSAPLVLPTLL
jgi:predicted transglutaminase-like cysteine proteinase